MKKLIANLLIALFFAPLAMNAGTPAKTETGAKKYNAYWMATTSDNDKITMGKVSTTGEALILDVNGNPESMNMELLDAAFQFSPKTDVNGKQIIANQYILIEEEVEAEMNASADFSLAATCGPTDWRCQATMTCFGLPYSQSWIATNPCLNSSNKMCFAYNNSTFKTYYISCK